MPKDLSRFIKIACVRPGSRLSASFITTEITNFPPSRCRRADFFGRLISGFLMRVSGLERRVVMKEVDLLSRRSRLFATCRLEGMANLTSLTWGQREAVQNFFALSDWINWFGGWKHFFVRGMDASRRLCVQLHIAFGVCLRFFIFNKLAIRSQRLWWILHKIV